MSEINWDLAPECTAYADVTFFDKSHCEVGNQLDIKCPQTKTVADKQEGEKWTHAYREGEIECKVIEPKPDFNGNIVVFNHFNEYQLIEPKHLKPIKPKLTKAEAWDKLMERKTNSSEVNTLKQQYEII
jgi:hypothetical protein